MASSARGGGGAKGGQNPPKGRRAWGDEDDDEYETRTDINGIKDRVKVTENAKGQKVQIVTKIRVTEVKERTPKNVAARKNLPKFGQAADKSDPDRKFCTIDKEYTLMEHPNDSLETVEEPTVTATLKDFIQMQAEREMARESGVDSAFRKPDGGEGGDAGGLPATGGPGKYVPPAARGAASAFAGAGGGFNLDEFAQKDTVIRVSNLTKSVTEDDLRDLFEPFGKVQKVKLPRATIFEGGREVGKEPKGFAYITFYRCEDAEVAFDKLQNYGYDHLILRLEWAKPAAEMPGGFRDGGLSGGYVSGYGQKLAQDTKEKVMYTNTLATAQAGEGRR